MTKKTVIYLAGPMEHVSVEDATGWRDEVKEMFRNHEVKVLDPCRRIHDFNPKYMKRIFELDIIDINNSNLIIANLDGMGNVPRHGTAMEVFYASYVRRIPVIAFKSTVTGVHPFFESLVTEWRSTHIKAAESVIDHYLE